MTDPYTVETKFPQAHGGKPHRLEWQTMIKHLIIGGGIGGVLTAMYLQKRAGVPSRSIRILDPHPTLLARWHANVEACGMRYLRSSSSHVLDTDFRSLRSFAARSPGFDKGDFTPPYRRPSVRLFRAHCEHIMQECGVPELHIKGTAQSLKRGRKGHLILETDKGALEAKNLILSLGAGTQPVRPDWAESAAEVQHIYDPGFRSSLASAGQVGQVGQVGHAASARSPTTKTAHVAIVGGGIGAAQHACMLVGRYHATVSIIARHEPTMSVFDFNPCYVGPSCLPGFLSSEDYRERRRVLEQERYPGTLPPDVYAELQALRESGSISWIRGEVSRIEPSHCGKSSSQVEKDTGQTTVFITPPYRDKKPQNEMRLVCDKLRLATGFTPGFNRNPLMRQISMEFNAPFEAGGAPIPGSTLEWLSRVFLVGRAAELEVGPPAANIIGMHNAAKRICSSVSV